MTPAAASALTRDEAFARIRLLRSPRVGPVSYAQLLARFGTGEAALAALPDLAGRHGRPYAPAPVAAIEAELSAVRRAGARYLFHDSPDYPALLRAAEGAPPILIARGEGALVHRPAVAIVGARNASAAAVRLARDFGLALAGAGQAVVSGLARGIDGAVHQGALAGTAPGGGGTIAVIACGIDVTYPPEHAALQDEVAARGLLLTEHPPGTEPFARHFPARNRIIAGIAAGTVVVEATPNSGSLITARLAGDLGREVMAIPGSPLDSRSHGCNQLIRDGAVLVQRPEDVLELLSTFDGAPRAPLRETAGPFMLAETADRPADIAGLLTTAPVAIDELVRQSGESAAAVQLALLELELAGTLVRHAGGRVSRAG
ncbi:DNA-processing protein DprA [Novosphingobium piscinae]|uniref:DNA-protecting protein DprA n=1 Tax=Novosphingobium piscinae TaxID=1507448 RepID=A0A7X1G021_9SPHN|nr:DNA-processing protein DprA [Novosphingobium piscinae]MBC2670161.1 DNA-protecting protein DprA [Novosphingobium piscinae]